MSVTYGPKLGLLVNANIAETYVDQFRPFLRAIDALLQGSVLSSSVTIPPLFPHNGDAYILLGTPTGAWAGFANYLAVWSTEITIVGTNSKVSGWEFYNPEPGWFLWDVSVAAFQVYNGTSWSKFSTEPSGQEIAFTTVQPGAFTIPHDLGKLPVGVQVEMTSGGQVWFQTPRYDTNNLYLVASDTGLTGFLKVQS